MATSLSRNAQLRSIRRFGGNAATPRQQRGAERSLAAATAATGGNAGVRTIVADALRRGFTQNQVRAALSAGGFNVSGARTAGGTSGRQVRAGFRAAGVDPGETFPA